MQLHQIMCSKCTLVRVKGTGVGGLEYNLLLPMILETAEDELEEEDRGVSHTGLIQGVEYCKISGLIVQESKHTGGEGLMHLHICNHTTISIQMRPATFPGILH